MYYLTYKKVKGMKKKNMYASVIDKLTNCLFLWFWYGPIRKTL